MRSRNAALRSPTQQGRVVSLEDYGWNEFFSSSFDNLETSGLEPARMIASGSGMIRLMTASGELQATLAGRLRGAEKPAVGDWVGIRREDSTTGRVELVLPRRSKLSRRAAGKRTHEQVVAANVDTVLIVMGLDGDYSPRRLERLLIAVWESGARPVVLLNKLDLCRDPDERRAEIESVSPGAPVLMSSCLATEGIEEVRAQIKPGETAVMIGSSGVGKSTLINLLLGEDVQETRSVREGDDRGQHTTTHRELFQLSCGGLIIDNPGIRELQLWSGEESVDRAFGDVVTLAESCRYPDCSHGSEPDCAIRAAIDDGRLASSRIDSYRALQQEVRYQALRRSESAQRIQKKKWRTIHKEMRRSGKHRKR